MGNGCSCRSIKNKERTKNILPSLTVDNLTEIFEKDIINNLHTYKEHFIGPYFLLDVENSLLSFEEKEEYIDKIIFLLTISNYNSLFKKKYNSDTLNQKNSMNKSNHKENFISFIFNLDLSIINSIESIKNIISYYQENIKELESFIFKGPPQIFRFILWRVLLIKNNICIKISDFIDLSKITINDETLREIMSDIPRTFPDLDIYNHEGFREKLKIILERLASYDKELNYVQGMNFILGYLLLIDGGNEFTSFNFFMCMQKLNSEITKDIFRDSLTPGFKLLFNYIDNFRKIFETHNGKLKQIFTKNGVAEFFWFSKWVQTLFTYNFNFYTVTRLWDIIFSKGLDFIFIISLSILDFLEKEFVKGKLDPDDCLKLFEKAYKFDKNNTKDLINFIVKNSKNKEFINYLKQFS